ncbi:MAG: restriction endonuclease [Acidobacteriaceae bacterium]|nr:restriction endonuclease [Acidobacteriaceae bacterium]
MPIPDYQTLMLPLLKLVADGKEWNVSKVVEPLADEFNLTEDERNQLYASGGRLFNGRVSWAKTYLSMAGLLESTKRAHFSISQRGREVLSQHPERITGKYLSQFPEFQRFQERDKPPASSEVIQGSDVVSESTHTPDETMRNAHAQLVDTLASELLTRIRKAEPDFMERLTARLLFSMGYGGSKTEAEIREALHKAWIGGPRDGGVDVVIDQDPLGLDRVCIQVKRYADGNTVGPRAIREFYTSLDAFKASKGLFVTSSKYSDQVREEVKLLSKQIVLIDGDQLTRLMIRYNVGCEVKENFEIKKIDEDFFDE